MRLQDNSGGFWTDLIIKRYSADQVVKTHLEPSPMFMRILGEEIVSSIKGGAKHSLTVTNLSNGVKSVTVTPNGSYKYGILKQTSPDGTPYAPLKESTLKIRKNVKGISRQGQFILRETSKHILNGLHVKSFKQKQVTVGWNHTDEELVKLNETERTVENPLVEYMGKQGLKDVKVPARKVRGFSVELQENILQMTKSFFGIR